jgi:hypothetical protein
MDARCRIQDAGCKMQDTRYKMQDRAKGRAESHPASE